MDTQKVITESPILRLRKEAGITQRELAAAADVDTSIVAGLEAGVVAIEEDAEIQGKVDELFTKLSEWTGLDKNELLQQQIEYNRTVAEELAERFAEKMKEFVAEKLREGAWEKYFGPQPLSKEIVDVAGYCLLDAELGEDGQSPVKTLREYAQISQRQLAIAAGVSQTVIARLETGELSFGDYSYEPFGNDVYVGDKLLRFLVDAIASGCDDKELKEQLALYIYRAQENFVEDFADRAKDKVMNAMAKLRKYSKDGEKAAAEEAE